MRPQVTQLLKLLKGVWLILWGINFFCYIICLMPSNSVCTRYVKVVVGRLKNSLKQAGFIWSHSAINPDRKWHDSERWRSASGVKLHVSSKFHADEDSWMSELSDCLHCLFLHCSINLGGNTSSSTPKGARSVYALALLPLPNVNINHLIVGTTVCLGAFQQMFLRTSTKDATASVFFSLCHTVVPSASVGDVKTSLLCCCPVSRGCLFFFKSCSLLQQQWSTAANRRPGVSKVGTNWR